MTTAAIKLWGTTIGYVSMDHGERFARFEYDPTFASTGIQLAPLMMPTRSHYLYQFPALQPRTFYGLPGLLADSLPDKYGNRLIDIWLAQTGRRPEQFNAVDRLCYIGKRGMGALEFEPATNALVGPDKVLEVEQLVALASLAFANKETLDTTLSASTGAQALLDILQVGSSAGGARAKAVIAFNPTTQQVRSGQLDLPPDFEHWLIKFDGVKLSGDWGVADPAGYGLLEYSYYLMAKACGLNMMESRLFSENGRHHFMTRRFDRQLKAEPGTGNNRVEPSRIEKVFMQTLGAVAHFDYWESGAYSYEQVFMTMKQLGIAQHAIEEQFCRMLFNMVGCNQDDHVKNITFTMNRQGKWELSPAYDLCHAAGSAVTRTHQLSINGKTSGFTVEDLKQLASYVGLPRGREKRILERTIAAFNGWKKLAVELGIPMRLQDRVLNTLRLQW
jgi:serine/threonine-protein kinase HipA